MSKLSIVASFEPEDDGACLSRSTDGCRSGAIEPTDLPAVLN